MTSDFALNNSMISKEEYLDKKAYYDYQRKVEWNREKCMKICEADAESNETFSTCETYYTTYWHFSLLFCRCFTTLVFHT